MKKFILFEKKDLAVKFIKNAAVFSAPALVVFFLQLEMGVDYKAASAVALLTLYGLFADYFKKIQKDS